MDWERLRMVTVPRLWALFRKASPVRLVNGWSCFKYQGSVENAWNEDKNMMFQNVDQVIQRFECVSVYCLWIKLDLDDFETFQSVRRCLQLKEEASWNIPSTIVTCNHLFPLPTFISKQNPLFGSRNFPLWVLCSSRITKRSHFLGRWLGR